jgi:DNA-binding MarR family transcriptional regulator
VRRLSDAGVLVRLADAADGRVVRLQLTPDAERRVTAWRDDRAAALADALATLDPADRERLQAALPALRTVSDAL